ncbi:hypothetical protein V2J09_012616 [Rumex salicifolius]
MGNLSYFLGVEVQPHPDGLFLSQRKYVTDVLHRAQMTDSKQVATPMCASTELTKNAGYLLSTPTAYRQLVGSLQYLSLTRPDIAFAVNKLSQYMQAPTSAHWASLKRLLRLSAILWENSDLMAFPEAEISLSVIYRGRIQGPC